jgi:hypothetical protein
MKKWILKLIKNFKIRFYKLDKGFFIQTYDEIGEYERISTAIIRKMINHTDTKFTIAPLSGKRYLVNKTLDIFVIIEGNKVEITNHVYHYVIHLSKRPSEKILKQYDKKVDDVRIEYENEIKSQINNTLHKIYDKIMNEEITDKNNI